MCAYSHKYEHMHNLLSPFTFSYMYMCPGLTIWDQIANMGACPGKRLIIPPPAGIDNL